MPRWINKLLGINQLEQQATKQFELLTGGFRALNSFNGDAWSNEIYRSAVDTIARHIAKLSGKHVANGLADDDYSKINRILRNRPNPYMSGYDFLYKIAAHYYLYNNAFIFIEKDTRGNLSGLYPLSASSVEYVVDSTNEMYLKFLFHDGEIVHFHISEIAVLRRHFNSNELLGDTNDAIMNTLDLAHVQQEGMTNSIQHAAQIRGVVKYNQALAPNKLKEAKNEFMRNYMTMENDGGVITLDANTEYTPLQINDTQIETPQLQEVRQRIYTYLGINERIVTGQYSEDDWQAFYESIIEPFAIQLSYELTEKIFTEREQAFSNRIIFESSRLQYASTRSKATVIKELLPLGVITINQALDLLNLPRVENGDERIQSLNYIDKSIANNYQLKGDDSNERD